MLIIGIAVQITKVKGFCSIPEIIQVIIHPNSKFRCSLSLEIAKNADEKNQFRRLFLDQNLVGKQN